MYLWTMVKSLISGAYNLERYPPNAPLHSIDTHKKNHVIEGSVLLRT